MPESTNQEQSRLLTIPEVAKLLAVSTPTAYRLVSSGEIASYRIGDKNIRVLASDVTAYLTGRRRFSAVSA